MASPFDTFLTKFEQSFKTHPSVIHRVLANVFSMRIIGNKTHGDLAEIALTEYINQFMEDFSARHTGKKNSERKNLKKI